MRVVAVVLSLGLALGLSLSACGGDDDSPGPSVPTGDEDGGSDEACVDRDGDGFGTNCSSGRDCDDSNPGITDECRTCGGGGLAKGCPCKPGTRTQSCTPPVMHVEGGTLVCKEGNRYCRDGYWSECETIGGYIFVAD
jgi:hypothetical protein